MTEINNLLKTFTTEDLEQAKDTVGGFQRVESGVYSATIKMAYVTQSTGGATGIGLELVIDKQPYNETVWVSSREGKNFYVGQDGTKRPLPGFTLINDLCLLVTVTPLANQETAVKKVEVYDWEAKGKVLKALPVLTDLIGQKTQVGILKQTVNKRAQNSAGVYVPVAEIREENVLHKVFHADTNQTANEEKAGVEAGFIDRWKEQYEGKLVDKTVPVQQTSKTSAAGMSKPRKNLFAD